MTNTSLYGKSAVGKPVQSLQVEPLSQDVPIVSQNETTINLQTLTKAIAKGFRAPLPIVRPYPASEYPLTKNGKIELDKDGNPKPLFNGKCPSHLDSSGKPKTITYSKYYDRTPSLKDFQDWGKSYYGFGFLCGVGDLAVVDIDRKHFDSDEECKAYADSIVESTGGWVEKTKTLSGGYHIYVRYEGVKGGLVFDRATGKHIGELLHNSNDQGGKSFCRAYDVEGFINECPRVDELPIIELEDMPFCFKDGLKASSAKPSVTRQQSTPPVDSVATSVSLRNLITKNNSELLTNAESFDGDRSDAITTLGKDLVGCENWCIKNNISTTDTVLDILIDFGTQLGKDEKSIERIYKGFANDSTLQPGCLFNQSNNDSPMWKKIKALQPKPEKQSKLIQKITESSEDDSQREKFLRSSLPPESYRILEEFPDKTPEGVYKEITQIVKEALYTGYWLCVGGVLHKWNGINCYEPVDDAVELGRIRKFLDLYPVEHATKKGSYFRFDHASPKIAIKCFEWVKLSVGVHPDSLNPPGLNCQNGILQLTFNPQTKKFDRKLIPHSPEMKYTDVSHATYDPSASLDEVNRMMTCLDPDSASIMLKTIAASLVLPIIRKVKASRVVKALMLFGVGNNGKDTLRTVAQMTLGKLAVSSVTIKDFKAYDEGKKFGVANLYGSKLNWASENSKSVMENIQSLKAAITGDPLDCEKKHVQGFTFSPNTVFMFNCNELPVMKGSKEAITSRYAIVSFNKVYKDNPTEPNEIKADQRFKEDPEFIKNKILPGFLNLLLDALDDLMLNGIDHSVLDDALEASKRENCHLVQFCEDLGLEYDSQSTEKIYPKEIFEKLQEWYVKEGWATKSPYDDSLKFLPNGDRDYDSPLQGMRFVFSRLRNDVFGKIQLGTKDKKGVPILGLKWVVPKIYHDDADDLASLSTGGGDFEQLDKADPDLNWVKPARPTQDDSAVEHFTDELLINQDNDKALSTIMDQLIQKTKSLQDAVAHRVADRLNNSPKDAKKAIIQKFKKFKTEALNRRSENHQPTLDQLDPLEGLEP
jgi:phage/plasmid-associated DNA primase